MCLYQEGKVRRNHSTEKMKTRMQCVGIGGKN